MATINWTHASNPVTSITGTLVQKAKNNGINWSWKSLTDVSMSDTRRNVYFAWQFEWDNLKRKGIDGFEATITVSAHKNLLSNPNVSGFPKTFTAQMTRSGQWVDYFIGRESTVGELFTRGDTLFKCVFEMKPIKNCDESRILEETFAASDKTDAILVVEGKKLHVNKQFLSFHSDYFNTMFNSEFKEKSMNEIPIGDVKYEDFARLLSVIYPNPINPNVHTYETLLELANRFMMPKVTHLVELVLIGSGKVRISRKIAVADKYSMNVLLGACLKSIKTAADMKQIIETSFFEQLSDATKAKLLYKTFPFF